MLLASVGSLPPRGETARYPASHIEHWLRELLQLGYGVIGTGEPGGAQRYGMVERFTQDFGGVEVRRVGASFKSFYVGPIAAPTNPAAANEVLENRFLRSLLGRSDVMLKATVTDPVTIGLELIANTPIVARTRPRLFWEVTEALTPIVEELSRIADIVQFDCPSHLYQPTRAPWQYVNALVERTGGKPAWIHLDGPVARSWRNLLNEYRVETLVLNLFGAEEEENLKVLSEGRRELREAGKRLGASVVKSQIRDELSEVEPIPVIAARLRRLDAVLGGDRSLVEALLPGCGLRVLDRAAQGILKALPQAAKEAGWL
ncbi:MAG: hypothetical protein QW587_07480 [Candidatus Bathyarchaeia archaeon]